MANNKSLYYRALLITCMVLACIGVQAKEIRGKVIDNEGKAVQGASVVVMSLPDSVFFSTLVTNTVGEVIIDTRESDSVLVTIQILGYERFQTMVSSDFTAKIASVSTQLEEVVVEAKPTFRTEAGKFVFTPGDLVKRVNNAQDILQYVPMVRITGTDISVLGSPQTIVYVNGKPPRGMMADIKNIIKSLPAWCIKRIEVIQNPGASVDGAYHGAVVNIEMTYPWEGFAGIVNASALTTPDILSPKAFVNLFYTKDKWSFALSGAFRTIADDDKNEDYYEYIKDFPDGIKSYINNTHHRKWTNVFGTTVFANYNFTDRSTLGLGVGIGFLGTRQKTITTTTYTTVTDEEYKRQSAIRDTVPYGTPNLSANLFYTLQTDDKGSNLDIVFGYFVSQTHTHTGMIYPEDTLFQKQSAYSLGLGGKVEYLHKFSRRVRLNVGAGFTTITSDNALDFYRQSNRFIYKENLLHLFGEVRFPWHRTSFVAGLRVETEFNTGDVYSVGDSFERNSTAVMPSISIDWQMPWHNQSLSASFSQHITRPTLGALNPFKIWTTENSYTEGNPYLKNYYFWNVTLTYMSVKNLMFIAKAHKSFGGNHALTLPDPDIEGVMATKRYDGPGFYSISADAIYSKELFDFWNIETSVFYSFSHSKFMCEGVQFKRILNRVGLSVKSIFNFSKKYGIFGSVYYSLDSPFTDYNDSRRGWINNLYIEIRKDWKEFSLSLNADGLIPLRYQDHNFDSDVYIARYNKTNYGPTIQLNFRYMFGNKQTRGVKTRNAGASSRFE